MPPMTSAAGGGLFALAQFFVLLMDLHGQFAGRHQNERGNLPQGTLCRQPFDHRDQEGQRLAGAGLRRRQYVFALECGRDRGRLDRRRGNEMEVCQLLLEPSRQGHIFELCQTDFSFWRGVSRGSIQDASRDDTTEAARFVFGAENETEAGKSEDLINSGSDVACKRPQPIASTDSIGMHIVLCKRTVTSGDVKLRVWRSRSVCLPAYGHKRIDFCETAVALFGRGFAASAA